MIKTRPRLPQNRTLPPNLYQNGNAYRYRRPDNGSWHGMGTDKAKAVAAARKLNLLLIDAPADLIDSVMGNSQSVGMFADYYLASILPPRKLAKNTIDLYTIRLNQIKAHWPNTALDSLNIRMIADYLATLTPRSSNQTRAILIDLLNHAAAKGYIVDNQAALTMPAIEAKQRKRHTIEGLAQIRAAAPDWLKNAIDLALLTTQRRGDLLNLKWSDIYEGYIHIAQQKTTSADDDNYMLTGAGYLRIKIDSQIGAVLHSCKASGIASPYVIHRAPDRLDSKQRSTKAHWTAIEPRFLTRAFKDARDRSGAYAGLDDSQMPTFHEIRALSIHLHKKNGIDAQKLAGHSSAKMTQMYAGGHADVAWVDVECGVVLPF